MKFGSENPPRTFIISNEENKKDYITYLAGLNFDSGSKISIRRQDDSLILEGPVTKESIDENISFAQIAKQVTNKETREIPLNEIQGIEIADKSGRSIGKSIVLGAAGALVLGPVGLLGGALLGARKGYKSFIVIQVKSDKVNIPYQVILGGTKQKEVEKYYDHLLSLIHESK